MTEIVVQKRSGKRHMVHPDGLATYCGRIIQRKNWRRASGHTCGCEFCWKVLAAKMSRQMV